MIFCVSCTPSHHLRVAKNLTISMYFPLLENKMMNISSNYFYSVTRKQFSVVLFMKPVIYEYVQLWNIYQLSEFEIKIRNQKNK